MAEEELRAYVEYFRDMGVRDFYRRGEPVVADEPVALVEAAAAVPSAKEPVQHVVVQQDVKVDLFRPDFAGAKAPSPSISSTSSSVAISFSDSSMPSSSASSSAN